MNSSAELMSHAMSKHLKVRMEESDKLSKDRWALDILAKLMKDKGENPRELKNLFWDCVNAKEDPIREMRVFLFKEHPELLLHRLYFHKQTCTIKRLFEKNFLNSHIGKAFLENVNEIINAQTVFRVTGLGLMMISIAEGAEVGQAEVVIKTKVGMPDVHIRRRGDWIATT